jgi:hypothetical protein
VSLKGQVIHRPSFRSQKEKNEKKTRFCQSKAAAAVPMMMAGGGDDDGLAALREQVALASSAAISASDLDCAFQLQFAEAIQASLRGQSPPAAASSSASPQAAPFLLQEPPSDAACAPALQAADHARTEQDRRDAEACRAAPRTPSPPPLSVSPPTTRASWPPSRHDCSEEFLFF